MPPVFEQVTFFYEVLLRFSDQKATRGQLTGAHLQTLTQTLMDGNVIATTDNGPKQLALLDGESGQKLSDVLGVVSAQTVIQNQTLSAALAAEQGKTTSLAKELTEAKGQADALAANLAASNSEIARLMALIPSSPLAADDETEQPADPV